ncbi:MAG: glycosyltransferase [Thermoanaerobaculia bacterium]
MNAPPAAPPRSAGVRIVLPVSGAPELLAPCLDSLIGATDLARHRLHLVLDGPQEEAVEAVVRERMAALGDPLVDRLAQRRGFAPAVNHGIRSAAGADVVLLNSDTEVPPGWLERLIDAAGSGERIASVTPLTNHGTIVSVPRSLVENRIPSGFTTATFDALVERAAERSRPRLPTGVGFCLYLRRAALDEIGPFDEARFGAGYGEEVDWCLRAAAAGWEHCADDATFVLHHGGGSFGAAKRRLEKRAESILRRRHRSWKRELSSFLERDPLAPVRQRILAALAPVPLPASGSRRLRVLHVVHGWPPWNYAGTELYAARLARAQAATMEVAAFGRIHEPARANESTIDFEDRGVRLRLVQNDFSQRLPWERNALANPRIEAAFDRFLNDVAPDIVHVHHLAGHSLRLPRAAARRGIPVVWQIQDWWHACARANLMHADRHLCAGPGLVRCGRCLPMTGVPPRTVWNPALHLLRRHLSRRALAGAALFVAGSRGVLDDLARFGMLPPGTPARVLDYGVAPFVTPPARSVPSKPLRVGFLGSLLPHKGLHLLAEAASAIPPEEIELHAWGAAADTDYLDEVRSRAGKVALVLHPPFEEDGLEEVFAAIDLLVAPSIGLESYAFVPREALARGVPLLAARRGALEELLALPGSTGFEPENVDDLRLRLREICEHAADLSSTPPASPKLFPAHVEEIASIYRALQEGAERT